MTEVDYGGGGHHTRLREINDQLVCLWGAPLPAYIKGEEERAGQGRGAPKGGNPTPSRFAPSLSYSKKEKGKEEVERRKERGEGVLD